MSITSPAAKFKNNEQPQAEDDYLNSITEEVDQPIIDSGQTPNKSNHNQGSIAMVGMAANATAYVDSGIANAYVLNPINNDPLGSNGTNKVPFKYLDDMKIEFLTPNANTSSAVTIKVGTLAAKQAKAADGVTNLVAGAIPANRHIECKFDEPNDVIRVIRVNGGTGGTLRRSIIQPGHGLVAGNVVRQNLAGDYVLAQADTTTNAEVVGIISGVPDANALILTVGGFIEGLSGLAAGTFFFLSATSAGVLTSSEPTGVTQISKPILYGDSTSSGYFFNMRGQEILDQEQTKARKNLFINPEFDIIQESAVGTSSTTNNVYVMDQWIGSGGDGSYTQSQQPFTLGQTDVPGEPEFFYQHDQSGAATSVSPFVAQGIESVRTAAGNQQVTVSFFALANTAINVIPRFRQNFGTGGSPSTSVDTDGTTLNITTAEQLFTATVTIPSISGKTLGSAGNDRLEFFLVLPTGITFIYHFSKAQFEINSVVTEFERRQKGTELDLAQRFYHERVGVDQFYILPVASATQIQRQNVKYPTFMRSSPTIVTTKTAGVALIAGIAQQNDEAFLQAFTGAADDFIQFTYTASSRYAITL